MTFVLRPRRAVLKITFKDGSHEMCASAQHVAQVLYDELGVEITRTQAVKLCCAHPYKRPGFTLPEGVSISRLNDTKGNRRNMLKRESHELFSDANINDAREQTDADSS